MTMRIRALGIPVAREVGEEWGPDGLTVHLKLYWWARPVLRLSCLIDRMRGCAKAV